MTNQVCNTVMIPVEEYEALRRKVEELGAENVALRKEVDTYEKLYSEAFNENNGLVRERAELRKANSDLASACIADDEFIALRKDAARYRWLRDQHQGVATKVDAEWFEYTEPTEHAWMVFRPTAEFQSDPVSCIPGELDAAIDAAILGEQS